MTETKKVFDKIVASDSINGELGLEIFEIMEKEMKNKGYSIVNWYLFYAELESNAVKELTREEKINFANIGYSIYLDNVDLEIEPISRAITNLLIEFEPNDISWSDIETEANIVMANW